MTGSTCNMPVVPDPVAMVVACSLLLLLPFAMVPWNLDGVVLLSEMLECRLAPKLDRLESSVGEPFCRMKSYGPTEVRAVEYDAALAMVERVEVLARLNRLGSASAKLPFSALGLCWTEPMLGCRDRSMNADMTLSRLVAVPWKPGVVRPLMLVGDRTVRGAGCAFAVGEAALR